MHERRRRERRSWLPARFPVTDRGNNRITEDRRQQPDRRIANIEVSWFRVAESGEVSLRR